MQSAFVALILLLLWQPAMTVAALSSQQNIIAVVVDDSRSMAIADSGGKTREAAALAALQDGGVLSGLQTAFPDSHLPAWQWSDPGGRAERRCTHGSCYAYR